MSESRGDTGGMDGGRRRVREGTGVARRQNREVVELMRRLAAFEAELGLGPLPEAPAKRRKAGGARTGLAGGGQPAAGFYPAPEGVRGPRRHRLRTGETSPPDPLSVSTERGSLPLQEGENRLEEGETEAGRAVVPYRPQSPAKLRAFEGLGRSGRRVRRWGDAARKVWQREVADGQRGLRSLRAVREAYPLSQQELAERARLARSTIAELEAGRRRAYPSTRRAIARVLGVEVGEIGW
jgi:DNA-binding XRE family transcriptional regulator